MFTKIKKNIFDTTLVLDCTKSEDERGTFHKVYNSLDKNYASLASIDQVNIVSNRRAGTMRGLHYQRAPYGEKKIVKVLDGKILDFILCINKEHSMFGELFMIEMSSDNSKSLVISDDFAHGYITLVDNTWVSYVHEGQYVAEYEDGINFQALLQKRKIILPVEITTLSHRDKNFITFEEYSQ